jgi:hypothetical protein
MAAVMTHTAAGYSNIDISSGTATYESLALDGFGVPYLAFRDDSLRTTPGRATVMYYDAKSQGWLTVGAEGFTAGTADWTSLAIDSSGSLLVAFADGSQAGKTTVMKYSAGSWSVLGTAGFSDGAASYVSLALDTDGTPYVAYVDAGNSGKLTVKKWTGSSWNNVGPAGFTAGTAAYASLGVSNHIPYVAFQDGSNGGKASVVEFK